MGLRGDNPKFVEARKGINELLTRKLLGSQQFATQIRALR
jgi:hypothetical protein